MRLEGKVVIVTGAAKGIGAAIAEACAREGARVAALGPRRARARTQWPGRFAGAAPRRCALPCDVTRAADVGRAVDAVARALGPGGRAGQQRGRLRGDPATEDIPEAEWDAILASNLTSVFLCSKAVLPIMKRQRYGRIVNLASVVGRGGAVRVTSHYAAAKAGVIGFTRHLALEVGADGITVNAVAPGTTATERVLKARTPEETRARGRGHPRAAAGRSPREIADAVVFLASDEAAFVNGATLDVNGGQAMA